MADALAEPAPDVMVFQEVTAPALEVLCAQPWIRAHYHRAAVTGGRLGNYGMLLLSRLPVERVGYHRLPTRLSRGYLRVELRIGGRPCTILGIHLESGKDATQMRARQLGRIDAAVRAAPEVVIMGDFNLRDSENGSIPAGYRDAWTTLRPTEPGTPRTPPST